MSVPRILHYPGSKWSMADWIISHMPEHTTYLEPFFGSGAVLFNKEPAVLETVNDLDGDVVNLFRVVRDRPEELAHALRWTPYARSEYLAAHEAVVDEIDQARRFLVRCWQSIRVKTGSISGWKCRGTPDDSYRIKQFNQLSDQILLVADRLKSCQIENRPALQVIERYNRPDVMIYADPPYLMATRNGTIYDNEMNDADHLQLLDALDAHAGPAIISGYPNQMYDDRLTHWRREERQQVIENGRSRTEVLWINPIAATAGQQRLF